MAANADVAWLTTTSTRATSSIIGMARCSKRPVAPNDIKTFEPIEPPWQAIRAWIPADDDESGTDTPELWDQTTGTAWKAPEIDLGDGRTLVLEYS